MDLLNEFQTLLPKAIEWAQEHSELIQQNGKPLTNEQIQIANKVNVSSPEKVKLLEVTQIPIPSDEKLKEAAELTGFLTEKIQGLTLGHSIYIVQGCYSTRLLSHELRHVYHYEVFGSIPEFLVEYLKQIVLVGYEHSVLEQDARKHEIE